MTRIRHEEVWYDEDEALDEFDLEDELMYRYEHMSAWQMWAEGMRDLPYLRDGQILLAFAASFYLLLPLASWPIVLPETGAISPNSLLSSLCKLLFSAACALLAPLLARAVRPIVAILVAGSIPLLVFSVPLLWGIPALVVLPVLAAMAGSAAWALSVRLGAHERSSASGCVVGFCAAVLVASAVMVALLMVGKAQYLECPCPFSVSCAYVGEDANSATLAGSIAKAVSGAGSNASEACDKVQVTPFCMGSDGELITRRRNARGERVLLVNSMFAGAYDEANLCRRTVDLLESDYTAALHTRWLDGMLWLSLSERGD